MFPCVTLRRYSWRSGIGFTLLLRNSPAQRIIDPALFFRRCGPQALRLGAERLCHGGVAQAGSLGYWMGLPYVRHGYMTAAVRAIIPFAFGTLRLHRLEAACLPHNEPSRRLLNRAGFQEEGLAQAYLKINGDWRDHRLFGLVSREGAYSRP